MPRRPTNTADQLSARLASCMPCCAGCLNSGDPEYADAAEFLAAQVEQILSDPLAPGLAGATEATLVYGSAKFRHPDDAHGRSYAAKITLETLDGPRLEVLLDGSGLQLLNAQSRSLSCERYVDVSDLLADHSPAYLAAFTEVNGIAPVVQMRPAARAASAQKSSASLSACSQQMQWTTLVLTRHASPAVRVRDSKLCHSEADSSASACSLSPALVTLDEAPTTPAEEEEQAEELQAEEAEEGRRGRGASKSDDQGCRACTRVPLCLASSRQYSSCSSFESAPNSAAGSRRELLPTASFPRRGLRAAGLPPPLPQQRQAW